MSRRISIHALRVEGDQKQKTRITIPTISIHALRVEGDGGCRRGACRCAGHFYPRPPGGGRHDARVGLPLKNAFLSTPSGWRATFLRYIELPETQISIHALRVEGDLIFKQRLDVALHFYPRPPGGGRPISRHSRAVRGYFYPRPPGGGRRVFPAPTCPPTKFLSTPSGWRATEEYRVMQERGFISIHALRVEGDR